jgi:hypothetical protein
VIGDVDIDDDLHDGRLLGGDGDLEHGEAERRGLRHRQLRDPSFDGAARPAHLTPHPLLLSPRTARCTAAIMTLGRPGGSPSMAHFTKTAGPRGPADVGAGPSGRPGTVGTPD